MADKRQTTQSSQKTPIVPSHESHGNSIAAWVAVGVIALGFLVLVVAWVRQDLLLYIIGAVVVVVGAVVGKVLSAMGFGVSHKPGD